MLLSEIFKKCVELFDKYSYLLKIFILLSTYIIGLFSTKFSGIRKKYKLKRILNLKKTSSELILPVREGHIKTDELSTSLTSNYVTYDEALILFELKKFLNELGGKITELSLSKDNQEINSLKNNFYFGGFLVNNYVRRIFKERFPMVKFTCSKYTYDTFDNIRCNLISNDSNDDKRYIQINGKNCLKYSRQEEGYIILIKMSGRKDFSESEHGTVHICFGNNSTTTLAAARCFTEHRSELYHRLKHRKNHYFAIAKCVNGEVSFNTFKDMTDEVFSNQQFE